jgi:hypothetical protein
MMTMKVKMIVIVNYVMPVVTWTAHMVMSDSEVMLMVARW